MGLLRRVAFTNSLVSGMIGKRRTKNTFDPRFATRLATYRFTPEISATTMINVETESTIPSNIRKERNLCERSVSRATKIGSRRLIRVFMYGHGETECCMNCRIVRRQLLAGLASQQACSKHGNCRVTISRFQ